MLAILKNLLSFIAFFCLTAGCASAQNLVSNGSFEEKSYCPASYNTTSLRTLEGWTQPTRGTPDHFDVCNEGRAGVPSNIAGVQTAFDGTAYAGLVTYAGATRNYREYIQTKLTRPLGAGEMICVEFWISCADHSLYVSDGLGFYFSKRKVGHNRQTYLDERPQVSNPRLHIVDNAQSWVKLSDTFIADGGEEYLTIGNFLPDQLFSKLKRTKQEGAEETSRWAYVYLDQVIVRPVAERSDCSCVNDLIKESVHDPPLQLEETDEVSLNSVYFAFDDSTLDAASKVQLQEVAEFLRVTPYTFVRVMGHTDVIGREGYNVGLSANRAKAVVEYLEYIGIDPARLEISYYGSQLPAADNTTVEGRAQNRRVEFSVLRRLYVVHD